MVTHGDYVSSDKIPVRIVRADDDSIIRVLFLDGFYDIIKPLYDYFEIYGGPINVSVPLPESVEKSFEWLFDFVVEFQAMGVMFSVAVLRLVANLVRERVSLGKFTYEELGFGYNFGNNFGRTSTKFLELPVEG